MNNYCLIILGVLFLSDTFAQQHLNGNMYLHYNVPYGSYYNIDQEITPLKLAPGTYWALTFGFNESKDGGYIGIQTDYSNSKRGMFIFSIWNATDAIKGDTESYAVNFGGEGTGKSCRISIPLVESHTYRLRIWQLETSISGTFWGAWIFDKTIGKEYYLGKIKTNTQTTLSNYVSNFVEYYGESRSCENVPLSEANFKSIKFNCDDKLGTCQSTNKPLKYHFADCVRGYCKFGKNDSNVIFGGN